MTDICHTDFRLFDGTVLQMNDSLLRLVYERVLKTASRKPSPFTLLPKSWKQMAPRESQRVYRHVSWGFTVAVSQDIDANGVEFLTFEVSCASGDAPDVEELRAIRQAFLGTGRVAFVQEPQTYQDKALRILYSTLDGSILPPFTRNMVGLPV